MKRFFILSILLFVSLTIVYADFGAVLSEGFLVEHNDETDFASKTTLAPWLSLPMGMFDFYASMGLSANYEDKWTFIPELQRLELSYRTHATFGIKLGRIPWLDPSLFTAKGYFDGVDAYMNLGRIRLGVAALYTGLLYKSKASINISPGDPVDYSKDLDWGNFGKTYFAPRRFFTSLYGEFPGIPTGRSNVYAGLLAQFDLSDAEEAFHTQYLLFRYVLGYKRFDVTAAGAMELEHTQANGFRTAYAFTMDAGMQTGFIRDRLSLGLRWASGEGSNNGAFFPLIREGQGVVLKTVFSGIMIIRANYQARLMPTLAASLGARYFIRTDTETFYDPYLENDSKPLGAEADASLHWNPFSDLSFSFAGGVFLPKTGNAFASDAPVRWSIILKTIFSF
jgi:hypothetical protein